MLRVLSSLLALLGAICFVTIANATMTTILPLRMLMNGAGEQTVALFGTAYFLGFTVGCFSEPPRILRVGYIRAFAAAAALCTSLAIIIDLTESVALWIVLRFLMGLCIAAIFASVDGWINATTPDNMRGKVFAAYGWCIGASAVLGQIVLVIWNGMAPGFITIVALAFNAAVMLVTLTRASAPETRSVSVAEEPEMVEAGKKGSTSSLAVTSFTALAAAVYAGLVTTAIVAILPAILAGKGITEGVIAQVIASFFIGRLIFQIPLGIIADKMDLRVLIGIVATLIGVTALLSSWLVLADVARIVETSSRFQQILFLSVITLLGGLVLPLYTLANSLAFSRAQGEPPVKIATTLLLVNSAGAVAGPVLVALALPVFGKHALSGVIVLTSVGMAVFASWKSVAGLPLPHAVTARANIPTTSVVFTASCAEVQAEAQGVATMDSHGAAPSDDPPVA